MEKDTPSIQKNGSESASNTVPHALWEMAKKNTGAVRYYAQKALEKGEDKKELERMPIITETGKEE